MAAPTLGSLRRAVSWHRRPLAALCAALAVLTTLAATRPDPPPSAPVVVAAQALPGGTRLDGATLRVQQVPLALVPEAAATDPAALQGRTLAAPVTAGSILTEAHVVAPRSTGTGGDQTVLAPVRLADPEVARLLRPGDVVDVLAADPTGGPASVVASDARVVSLPAPEGGGGLLQPSASGGGALVVLEVSAADALDLAAAGTSGGLGVVLG